MSTGATSRRRSRSATRSTASRDRPDRNLSEGATGPGVPSEPGRPASDRRLQFGFASVVNLTRHGMPARQTAAGEDEPRTRVLPAFRWPDALDLLARAGAGSVFLYAGVVKAMDRQAMVLAVHGYRLAPSALEK